MYAFFPNLLHKLISLDTQDGYIDLRGIYLFVHPFGPIHILQGYGGKKRKKNIKADAEKPREVVHVRARRGEATDSHSLAERVRFEISLTKNFHKGERN